MEITAYTLPGCSSCNILKQLFQRAEVEYTEVNVGTDIELSVFQIDYPTVSAFPFVVIDGEKIGSLLETAKLFVDKGLVSSKKSKPE